MQKPGLASDLPAAVIEPAPPLRFGTPRLLIWLAPLVGGPLLLLLLLLFSELDQEAYHSPLGHALISGGAAVIGTLLALLILRIATRAQDGRVFLVGMGFLSTASLFFVHAIATPNVVLVGRTLATSLSVPVSLLIGGLLFAASGLDLSRRVDRWINLHVRLLLTLFVVGWMGYAWLMLFWVDPGPTSAQPTAGIAHDLTDSDGQAGSGGQRDYGEYTGPSAHTRETPVAAPPSQPASVFRSRASRWITGLAGLLLYGFAVTRQIRLYRRAPSLAGLAIICGITLFGEALVTQLLSKPFALSFWLYHAQEFGGFGVISYGILVAYRQGTSEETLLESLFLSRTQARIQTRYARVLDTLVDSLSRGDRPSGQQRALLSSQFGLSESQLHTLEHAAQAVANERQQRQELERLNHELRELERSRDQLTQMVVHDLKNPLTALVGFLEIVRLGPLSEDQSVALEGALRSGKNLNGLISDLLDIGRMEAGRLELEQSLILPLDLLTSSAAELSAWLQQEEKQLVVDTPFDMPLIRGDLRLLKRVLLNLISNAIKHTPPGTRITLRARGTEAPEPEGWVVLEVEDNGPGIPPAAQKRIFEEYVSGGGERGGQQNTGLGLTFCRMATEAHGGQIGLRSAPKRGTLFWIMLPGERLE
jgi:signal transduction histidine kinase